MDTDRRAVLQAYEDGFIVSEVDANDELVYGCAVQGVDVEDLLELDLEATALTLPGGGFWFNQAPTVTAERAREVLLENGFADVRIVRMGRPMAAL